jgi:putative methionine-R-sulfoxide reductase with GAF domain
MSDFKLKFLNLGTVYIEDENLKRKVQQFNCLNLFLTMGICFPMLIYCYLQAQSLISIPLSGIVIYFVTLFLLAHHGHIGARIISFFSNSLILAHFHALSVPPGEKVISSLILLQFSLVVLPFLYFELKEKEFMALCSLSALVLIGFQQQGIDKLEGNYDSSLLRGGFLHTALIIYASLITFTFLMMFIRELTIERQRKRNLTKNLHQKREDLQQTEKQIEKSIETVAENRREEEKRNWAMSGNSYLTDIIRQYDSLEEMGNRLVLEIADYLQINQTGLYLIDELEEQPTIKLLACNAYNEQRYQQKNIAVKNTLLGQAYQERDKVYLLEIPQDYLFISSGLGKSIPKAILIIPLLFNDNIVGLLEMASLREFEEHEINFIKKFSESLAVSIHNIQTNERTRELLEEAHIQTEQLQAHEEEMRQNMEELSATQEDMYRKEREYQQYIKQLEKKIQNSINTKN